MRNFSTLYIALCAILCVGCTDAQVRSAEALAGRVVPQACNSIRFVRTADTLDVFTLSSEGGKVVISAPDANSMAVGLNYYLKNWCETTVSWYLEDKVELPAVLPLIEEPLRVEARVDDRFFLNYCTFGYSIPWWNWEQWERLIDWMALNGVTRPLAITGQEAVWQKVWRKYGMDDDAIRAYFTGPTILPWQRMMNVDRWLGPLPQDWIDAQAKLQKKIVARERELGMKPVLSAFSGHIPMDMMAICPDAKILPVSLWDGFGEECRTYMLHPDDPLFARIQKDFLEEQSRMFGTDHIYGLDIFNEVDFFGDAEWDPQELARISHHVYETLTAADSEAIWLQMGWMFYHASKNWTPANIEAYLGSVPQGKVVILDYFCEKSMVWEYTNSFYGQPYYLCFLGNFGGNTLLEGDFDDLGPRFEKTLAEGGDNLAGFGCTLEGFGVTQFLCEYTLDKAWDSPLSDEQWIEKLADRRGGHGDANLRLAWKLLCHEIFTEPARSSVNSYACRRPHMDRKTEYPTRPYRFYDPEVLEGVWELIKAANSKGDAALFDIVAIGTKVLEDRFEPHAAAFIDAYWNRDLQTMENEWASMAQSFDTMEALLSQCGHFSLDKWIAEARRWGKTDVQKDYYETAARCILCSWGGAGQLTDYASRQWSGLMGGYFKVRWEMFCQMAIEAVRGGWDFDQAEYDVKVREFELSFSGIK